MQILHFPYLQVYRFSLACCGAVCFLALVEILVEDSMVIYFLVVGGWFLFGIVLIFFGMFLG
jgi:hypothetical protein